MPSTVTVRTKRVVFEAVPIRNSGDIAWLRHVLNQCTGWQEPLLHQHQSDGYRYGYPLVQYRSEQGKAVLFGLEAGCELIDRLLDIDNLPTAFLLSRESDDQTHDVRMLDGFQQFRLHRWAGLNTEHYAVWQSGLSLRERAEFMERVLVRNIFEFCKAVRFDIPNRSLEVRLLDLKERPRLLYPKYEPREDPFWLPNFDVIYETNLALPTYLGLGKGKSKGFGWQVLTNDRSL